MERTAFTMIRAAPAAAIERGAWPQCGSALRSVDQEEPLGHGWHDSSWALRTGLDVSEDLPLESLPPEWQMRLWLSATAKA
jgi:hypothetical protein